VSKSFFSWTASSLKKWFGPGVKLDGEDLLIMKESDIFGIVD